MMKKIIVFSCFYILLGCRISQNQFYSEGTKFDIEISVYGNDNQKITSWMVTDDFIQYRKYSDCEVLVHKLKGGTSANRVLPRIIQVDSLDLMNHYGCEKRSSIGGGESAVQIVSSFSSNNKDRHFNFWISDCFIDSKIDSLISELNKVIRQSSKIPLIGKIQARKTDCRCKEYVDERVFKK